MTMDFVKYFEQNGLIEKVPDNYESFNHHQTELLKLYFEKNGLAEMVSHHHNSYNHFVNHQMKATVDMFNPIQVSSEACIDKNMKIPHVKMTVNVIDLHLSSASFHDNKAINCILPPNTARLSSLTYSSMLKCVLDIKYIINVSETEQKVVSQVVTDVNLGRIPVMVRSDLCTLKIIENYNKDECKYDKGGYFIINGSEKVVVCQEKVSDNKLMLHKETGTYVWKVEVKSVPDDKCVSPKQFVLYMLSKGNSIVMNMPKVKTKQNYIPVFIIFRALGVISDLDICKHISLDINADNNQNLLELLESSIHDGRVCMTYESSIEHISRNVNTGFHQISEDLDENGIAEDVNKKKMLMVENMIENELFPHCKTIYEKRYYLGYMVRMLLLAKMGVINEDDRDSLLNKRIEVDGTLLNNLFRAYYQQMVKSMMTQLKQELKQVGSVDKMNMINEISIHKMMRSSMITQNLKKALSTGDFAPKIGNSMANNSKAGVGQVLNRLNFLATWSHLRRVATPQDKSGKVVKQRMSHSSTYGFICPMETPEGAQVGQVKNMSVFATITIPMSSGIVYDYVKPYVKLLGEDPNDLINKMKVFINGCWIGVSDRPIELYESLLLKKRNGMLSPFVGVFIIYVKMELHVYTDGGRMMRPLVRVSNGKSHLTHDIIGKIINKQIEWHEIVSDIKGHSVIEWLSADEIDNRAYIAMHMNQLNSQYTHIELHPACQFGLAALFIPFSNYNQSPRVMYQCAQCKQAMGMSVTNDALRMDKTSYKLNFSMRPVIDTFISNILNIPTMASGTQLMVALYSCSGYNQEDSFITHKAAIKRGCTSVTVYHTEKDEEKHKSNGDEDIRCKPNENITKGMKMANYNDLDANGFVPEGTLLQNRHVIQGKISAIKENKNDPTKKFKFEDHSKIIKVNEPTYVDKNYSGKNEEGYCIAKTRTRTPRDIVIGDKLSSRHGQKGTVGYIVPSKDMPYTSDGMIPDIIINPHAIPSRMTGGHMIEALASFSLLLEGAYGDGTAFEKLDTESITKILIANGFNSKGEHVFIDGITGNPFSATVFMGSIFYQRLKHMVNDKVHSRATGKNACMTRQPLEGKINDGGLKIGEMERDCFIAHGTPHLLQERLLYSADKFMVYICDSCGSIVPYNEFLTMNRCLHCDETLKFSRVKIPYAMKLMTQELQVFNVNPRFITSN